MMRRNAIAMVACVIGGAACCSAQAQMAPIAASGWNRDIVVENTAVAPWSTSAMSFDTFNNQSWYERGLAATSKGLPQGGGFNSALDGARAQFQPYTANNALFMDQTNPTATLTIDAFSRRPYDAIAVFASSSNGGGVGTMVIAFTDASTSPAINFNAQDWFNVTTNNALINLGRANLNTSTADDASPNNPRIYQTNVDLVALGLNSRTIASITFTKPTGASNSLNTVVMALSGQRPIGQLNPISATGYNRDVVVEAAAAAPFSGFASSFDATNNLAFYESGLAGSTKGLPAGGAFNSITNPVSVHGQLQPYNAPNVLFLNPTLTAASGTLTMSASLPYEFLAIFANSAGGGGQGALVVNFTDGTSSGNLAFNAQDWFNTTTNNAINNAGRVNLNTNAIDDASAGNPRIYQTLIDLGSLGFASKLVQSITFTKPATGASCAVWGVSGQSASSLPGACCATTGGCSVTAPGACNAPALFQGPSTSCAAGATCPTSTLACCNITTGACVFLNGTSCPSGTVGGGGGAATTCAPSLCPPVVCCNAVTGACTTGFSACPTGTTLASGATCSPSPCPPSGACCSGANNQSCSTTTQSACSGSYSGNGTVCSPNPCFTSDECQTTSLVLTLGTTVTGSNVGATNSAAVTQNGQGVCNQATFSTGVALDVFWKFTAPATAAYQLHTCGSTLTDTILSIHSACPVDSTNLITCNDDSTTTGGVSCATVVPGSSALGSNIPSVTLTAGTLYYIRVAGYNGSSGTYSLTINLLGATGSCCDSGACTRTDAANCSATFTSGAVCQPNPCAGGSGVCCRGATCNTTVPQASCAGAGLAGANFAAAAACNSGPISNSPCCYADYNKQGNISVQDIFDFLSDWFAGSPFANTGGNGAPGTLSVQNIFDFLSDWFAGGC